MMPDARPPRTGAFISYSHRDKAYLDQLHTFLKPRFRDGALSLWDDTQLQAGDRWRAKIEQALATARVAVLLVSADFLASDFITQNELPPLLEAAEREGAVILPVFVRPCLIEDTPLEPYQGINSPDQPLSKLTEAAREEVWVALVKHIRALLAAPAPQRQEPAPQPAPQGTPARPPLGILLTTCQGHTGSVRGVVWSPDGSRLASASDDWAVQVWSAG